MGSIRCGGSSPTHKAVFWGWDIARTSGRGGKTWTTLRIPRKSEQRENPICLGFYMTEDSLLFVEETGDLRRWLEKRLDKIGRLQTPDQILLQLMELKPNEKIN